MDEIEVKYYIKINNIDYKKLIFDYKKIGKVLYLNNKSIDYVINNKEYMDWNMLEFTYYSIYDGFPVFQVNIRKLKIKKLLLNKKV